jgi:HK97 family phage major capsid protein
MDPKELEAKLAAFATRVKAIGDELKTLVESTDVAAKARHDELAAEQSKIAAEVAPLLLEKEKAETREAIKATQSQLEGLMSGLRTASKAGFIGAGFNPSESSHEYKAGSFISAIEGMRTNDPEQYAAAKATLAAISRHEEAWGKAALGTTDAAGGWIIPNALVDTLIKPQIAKNIYRQILTVREGVTAFAVDIPFRGAAPGRAVIAPFGSTKENVDLVYNGYTATMYTLARIHDLSNQFIRQSSGAAEADVVEELANAFTLGEAFYIREGTGSSQPYGYTSALTNGPAAYRTTFTPSSTTLAGSMASAIALAAGALAGRGVTPTAAVVSATSYWIMIAQGTDNAGFFFAPAGGPMAIPGVQPGTLITPFGIPVYGDAQADVEGTAAVTDNLVVGDWKSMKVYFGESYRMDSSSTAGTRWDANITGFRGEEEMGFDARPAVYSGHFQMITDITP